MRNTTPLSLRLVCALVIGFFFLFTTTSNAQFDVAITKTTVTSAPVKYGTVVPFNITIYNQGTDSIVNIVIIDHVGAGFEFVGANNPDWSMHPTIVNAFTTTYVDAIPPGENRIVTINLTAQPADDYTQWENTAEVVSFTDTSGVDRTAEDPDSTGDEIPDNDAGGLLGSPADNFINGDGTGAPNDGVSATDEDDHDKDTVRIADLALIKVLDPIVGYNYGDTLTFETTVYNQGNITTRIIRVRDIIPEGYINPVAVNVANGWTSDPVNPEYTIDSLNRGDSITFSIQLILDQNMVDEFAWVNYAEIISMRDDNLVNISALDADSTPGSNTPGERSVNQGDPDDNYIGNNPVNPGDQDDHDPATPEVFDLALIKERATALSSFNYGTPIEYAYTVVNQGNMDATDVVLVDSLPCGAFFDAALNPDWTYDDVTRIATTTIPSIPAATTIIDTLILTVVPCYIDQFTAWTNYMEIAQATNANGVQTTEIDGVFDSNFHNDPGAEPEGPTDNLLTGIGVVDEDNHDVELLQVYDLALRKDAVTMGPYVEGQDIDFRIRVYNQGNVIIQDLIVEDFIQEGYGFDLSQNTAAGWTTSYSTIVGGVPTTFPDTLNVMNDIFLQPEDSIDIFITLQLEFDGTEDADWYNYSHVWVATDTVGNNRFDDADSNPFTPTALEFSVLPGSPQDNDIYSLGKSETPPVEEDDFDVAQISFFDLSTEKTLTSTPTSYGDIATYDIVVKNEGTQYSHDITITDYLPCGLAFNAGDNPGWGINGVTGYPEYFYTDTLFSGDSIIVPIQLVVEECAMNDYNSWNNEVEISNALDSTGNPGDDQDSTPDDDPENDPPGEDDTDEEPLDVLDLKLTKSFATTPTDYSNGAPIDYNIVVTNEGNFDITTFEVTDYIPCGFDFIAGNNPGWSLNGVSGNLEYTYSGTLVPGDSTTISLQLNIGTCDLGDTPDYTNIAEISNDDQPGSMTDDFDSTPDTDPNNDPVDEDDIDEEPLEIFDLSLEKTSVLPTPLVYGATIPYTITITNEGTIPANNIEVTDYIPCGLLFVGASNPTWGISGTDMVSTTIAGPLNPGESTSVTINMVLEECVTPTIDSWNNSAEISNAEDPDGNPGDDTDSTPDNDPDNDPPGEDDIDDDPIDVFDLSLTKVIPVDPANYSVGTAVNYEIEVTNEGNVVATEFVVTDYLPCGLDFAAGSNPGWSVNGSNVEYTFTGTLNPGSSTTISLQLTIGSCSAGETPDYTNAAEISNDDPVGGTPNDDVDSTPDTDPNNDPVDEDDYDEAPIDIFDLSLEKTSVLPTPLVYGATIPYTITVTNEGTIPAYNIEVTDYIPCGLFFVGASNPGWSVAGTGMVSTTIAGPLNPGESTDVTINMILAECATPTTDSWNNSAEISNAEDPDGNPGDDTDSTPDNDPDNDPPGEDDIDDDPIDVFDLSLTKIIPVDPANYSVGTAVNYEIEVTNEGNVVATNFVVTDYLPCGLDFAAGSNPGWSVNGSNVEYTFTGTLNPGSSTTISLQLTIGSCSAGETPDYTNAAEISNDDPVGGTPNDDVDSTPDTDPNNDPVDEDDYDEAVIEIYDLSLEKTSSIPTSLQYGSIIPYTITVTNEGSVPAYNVEVSDYLPCGLQFNAGNNAGWTSFGNTVKATIAGPIMPGSATSVTLNLTLVECANPTIDSWNNIAEISGGEDPDGDPGDDTDSTPDDDPNNDPPGEDDTDDDPQSVFDLSIAKVVSSAAFNYEIGDPVTYEITVSNEGNVTATSIGITDYIPCGLELGAGNTGWSIDGNGYAVYTIPGPLMPGQSTSVSISFTVTECADETGERDNLTEIVSAWDDMSNSVDDIDSTPDNDPTNDAPGEDDIDNAVISVFTTAIIGDFVFNDLDGDGIQDLTEPGIPQVIVQLYTPDDDLVATTLTDNSGYYSFPEVEPGDYYVVFTVDDAFIPTVANVGDDTTDSDVTEEFAPGSTSLFTVIAGDDNTTIDGGFYACALIKGVTYYDINEDDVRQTTENGINGLLVEVYRRVGSTWVLFDSEYTHHDYDTPSDDGIWDFCVPPGTYYVKVNMPPIGLVRVRPFIGGSNFDSDINNANGLNTTPSFTLGAGGSKTDLGAGYYPMATVGNLVWLDEDGDGLQGENEPKVGGVTVEAYDENNELIGQSVTDEDGIYEIDYLEKQDYYLKFAGPSEYSFVTIYGHENEEDSNSDITHSMGLNTTDMISFNPGDEIINIDAGLSYSVLPLEWLSFEVNAEKSKNVLVWKTAAEVNTSHFEVERQNVDGTFEYIGKVEALNIGSINTYTFDDEDIRYGTTYYRVKQVDLDGRYTFSTIENVYRLHEDGDFVTYPIPAVDFVTISGGFSPKNTYSIDVITANGILVKQILTQPSGQEYALNLEELTQGMYVVSLRENGEIIYETKVLMIK